MSSDAHALNCLATSLASHAAAASPAASREKVTAPWRSECRSSGTDLDEQSRASSASRWRGKTRHPAWPSRSSGPQDRSPVKARRGLLLPRRSTSRNCADRAGQISPVRPCIREPQCGIARETNRSPIDSASSKRFLAGRPGRDHVTGLKRRDRLPVEDLGQPPRITDFTGEVGRLVEIRPRHIDVVRTDRPACHERPYQQRRILEIAGDGQGLARLRRRSRSHRPTPAGVALSASARPRAGRMSAWSAASSASAASSQANPSSDVAARQPQRLQRRRQPQRQLDLTVFATPSESRAQVVDLGFGLIDPMLVTAVARRVQLRRLRHVVVAVACTHLVGLAGFAELFQRVLAHGLQQPVTRSAAATFGHHERFVDEQGELIEDLKPLDIAAAADRLRRVEIEAAQEHRQPAKQRPARARSTTHATSPPRRATSAGDAPPCAHRRSAAGSGREGCRRFRPVTGRGYAPRRARSPAACRRGAGRSPSPRPRCRR